MKEALELLENKECDLNPIFEGQTCIELHIDGAIEDEIGFKVYAEYEVLPWVTKGRYNVNPEKNIRPELQRGCSISNVTLKDYETGQIVPVTSEKAIAFIEQCIDEYYLDLGETPWDY